MRSDLFWFGVGLTRAAGGVHPCLARSCRYIQSTCATSGEGLYEVRFCTVTGLCIRPASLSPFGLELWWQAAVAASRMHAFSLSTSHPFQ